MTYFFSKLDASYKNVFFFRPYIVYLCPLFVSHNIRVCKSQQYWVTWVTQLSVRLFLILAQVMISRLVGLSPASGSALTAQSLLGILSLSPSLSIPPLLSLFLSK